MIISAFYFSLFTLIIGILGAIYLFIHWLRHRQHKFSLFWSIGLFLLYWYQVPFILANAGIKFVLTDFNIFYSIALPLTFLGNILIYLGILSVLPFRNQKRVNLYLFSWFIFSVLVFVYYFIIQGGYTINHVLHFTFIFLFFLPLYLLILLSLWRWFRKQGFLKTKPTNIGLLVMILAILLKVGGNLIVIPRMLTYPPQFWFITLTNFNTLFFLEALSTLLLLAGFFLVYGNCCKIFSDRT